MKGRKKEGSVGEISMGWTMGIVCDTWTNPEQAVL